KNKIVNTSQFTNVFNNFFTIKIEKAFYIIFVKSQREVYKIFIKCK
ncbi:11938_t:CDS:1, partial [Gigaspora margarita]